MSDKPTPLLKEGDIIIANDDITIYGTGYTFHIWKGKKYRIQEYLPFWVKNAWNIKLVGSRNYIDQGWFTEDELFRKFDCLKWSRREKLKKVMNNENKN